MLIAFGTQASKSFTKVIGITGLIAFSKPIHGLIGMYFGNNKYCDLMRYSGYVIYAEGYG